MNRNSKNIIMDGITALQWAREISKLPDGEFILAFYPYSRQRGEASTVPSCPGNASPSMERITSSIPMSMENLRCATESSSGSWASLRTDINYTK